MKPSVPSGDSASNQQSSPTRRRYQTGDVVAGKYELVRVLGQGGMGEVWEARNRLLNSAVAIKVLRGDLDEERAGERLLQEARAAAQLGHPAIVRVFDVGETHLADPFIVMELLVGDNLGELLAAEGRLSAVAAIQILLPIADALGTAHHKGIVHRDIKPENIYVAEEVNGEVQPKLVDFGVAKLENAEVDAKLTLRGTIVGSPSYLAPEQARGSENADYRVDIWGFSVVIYELITGVPPFNGGNYNALLRSIVEDDPKPIMAHAAGDAELWELLERGLRKNPEERWPSMHEYGRALAQWAFAQGVDEDICGIGLEAKWLSTKTGARGHLLSDSFDEVESPSAVRRRRRLSSAGGFDAVGLGLPAAGAPTNAPPPPEGQLPLPSPAREMAGAPDATDPALRHPEPWQPVTPPTRRSRYWLVSGGLALLLLALVAFATSERRADPPAITTPPKVSEPETKPTEGSAVRASLPENAAPTPKAPPASAEKPPQKVPVLRDTQAKTQQTSKPIPQKSLSRNSKVETPAAPKPAPAKKRPEKPLTPAPEPSNLDLKRPY